MRVPRHNHEPCSPIASCNHGESLYDQADIQRGRGDGSGEGRGVSGESMSLRDTVENALRDGAAIPAGPAVMGRIAALCKDPNASARDLAKVLQLDPSLTTRVLKQVNSSFYGLSATIRTVTHAVVILGFQEVKNIAMAVPVAKFFQDSKDAPGLDIEALWNDTIIVSCIARALSYHIRYPVPEQVFVSAMLSRSGMVVLNTILGESYRKVVEAAPRADAIPQLEQAVLGITHVDVGEQMARKWHFPPELLEAITRQYDPIRDGRVLTEPGLIHLARNLLDALHRDQSVAEALAAMPSGLVTAFKVDEASASEAVTRAADEFEDVRAMLSGEGE